MAEASLTDLPLCQRAIADCWQFEQERDRVLAELQRALAPDNNVDKYALSSAVLSASFEHVLTICSCVGTLHRAAAVSQTRALLSALRRGRLEYAHPIPPPAAAAAGSPPPPRLVALFTAPHSITVARDGADAHKIEDHTYDLARALATGAERQGGASGGAACVRWSKVERARLRAMRGSLDPTNRDPNYLRDAELSESPWFWFLADARVRGLGRDAATASDSATAAAAADDDDDDEASAAEAAAGGAPPRPSWPCALHVDVHGMGDVDPATGARRPDAYVGTAAMARREATAAAANGAEAAATPATAWFRDCLEDALLPVLLDARWRLAYDADAAGRVDPAAVVHVGGRRTPPPKLTGDWYAHEGTRGRNTLTQMSTDPALWAACAPRCGPRPRAAAPPYTHAVQLELSARLRKRLAECAPFATALGAALANAFANACLPPPGAPALSPAVAFEYETPLAPPSAPDPHALPPPPPFGDASGAPESRLEATLELARCVAFLRSRGYAVTPPRARATGA